MSDLPPDQSSNHASDHSEHEDDSPHAPHHRAPLLPPERRPQFGCGFTLWVPLFFFTPLALWFSKSPMGWGVLLSILLIGLIAALVLMLIKKWRWFGIGLLAGLFLYGLLYGFLFGIIYNTLYQN